MSNVRNPQGGPAVELNTNYICSRQIESADHRMLTLSHEVRSNIAFYLFSELDIAKLKDGPFDIEFLRDDGSTCIYRFAFRGQTPCGKRLVIAVDDDAYAAKHNLEEYLQILQRLMSPAVADEIYLLTERGLECSASPAEH